MIACPKCKSTEVHAEKRGWSLLTGFIGSGKIVITCLACGKRFRPGEQATQQADSGPQRSEPRREIRGLSGPSKFMFYSIGRAIEVMRDLAGSHD